MSQPLTARNDSARLLRWGRLLEWSTLAWNVVGVGVLTVLVLASRSVALLGFGLDSVIEIGASFVVLWELSGTGELRQRRAMKMIGAAFIALAIYLATQSTVALVEGHRSTLQLGSIGWTALTALVMFFLAAAKGRVGRALGNPVLETEGRVTFVDGLLSVAVLVGVIASGLLGWWWADSVAAYVIVVYAVREAAQIFWPRRFSMNT